MSLPNLGRFDPVARAGLRPARAFTWLALGALAWLGALATGHAAPLRSVQSAAPPPVSTCLAVARDLSAPLVRLASTGARDPYTVRISFQGHSTYLIESPTGVRLATDYAGWMTDPGLPDAVTMNNAHSTHFTMSPDPKIGHVFRGWPDRDGEIARHNEMVGDVLVRNVTTDIVRFGTVPDGNSIFIFEVAGLCIGHLGHLHHKLSQDHYTKIGRLDVVMIPVDGGLTMSHETVREILARLRSSVVLPMHVRSVGALPRFIGRLEGMPVINHRDRWLELSLNTLPKQPTVVVMPGVGAFTPPDYD